MSSLAEIFTALNQMRQDNVVDVSERIAGVKTSMERVFERKAVWHREQAQLPLEEKVRILLELQCQDLVCIRRLRPLRSWERPWPVTP